jgi:hypothetical protein
VTGTEIDHITGVECQGVCGVTAAALRLRHRDRLDAVNLAVRRSGQVEGTVKREDVSAGGTASEIDIARSATADMAEVGGILNDQEVVAVAAEQVVDTRTGD